MSGQGVAVSGVYVSILPGPIRSWMTGDSPLYQAIAEAMPTDEEARQALEAEIGQPLRPLNTGDPAKAKADRAELRARFLEGWACLGREMRRAWPGASFGALALGALRERGGLYRVCVCEDLDEVEAIMGVYFRPEVSQ